jgi:hypothetical protein
VKKRKALNVVDVKMAEEYVGANSRSVKFLLEFLSEKADSGTAVKYQDLVGIGPHLDTGSISSIDEVVFLWSWR